MPADGDCNFTAVTRTVPQEELRAQILRAAEQWGIEVPAEEHRQGADEVGWLVGRAVAAALEEEALEELRTLIADALQQEGRPTERVPDEVAPADRAAWLYDRAVERLRAVPPLGPGEPVTGQHLRLFLAYLWKRDSSSFGGEGLFAPDGTRPRGPGDIVLTRAGMGAALRWPTDYGPPYADAYTRVIAHFPSLRLQVLQESGEVELEEQADAGEALPYTIVHVNEHYLATRRRPGQPATSAAPTAEPEAAGPQAAGPQAVGSQAVGSQAVEESPAGVLASGQDEQPASTLPPERAPQSEHEPLPASVTEVSPQSPRPRLIAYNGSPAPLTEPPATPDEGLTHPHEELPPSGDTPGGNGRPASPRPPHRPVAYPEPLPVPPASSQVQEERAPRAGGPGLRTDVLTMFAHRGVDGLDLTPAGEATADGDAQVVRIVPAGGLVLDAQALDLLRQHFEGRDQTVFVPGEGSRVEVRQLDLVVLGPGGGAGSWERLADEMPDRGYTTTGTGRLARDMRRLDIEPAEGELVTWAAELSALPVSLAAQPGDSARPFGVELEFDLGAITDAEWAERVARILATTRREQRAIPAIRMAGIWRSKSRYPMALRWSRRSFACRVRPASGRPG